MEILFKDDYRYYYINENNFLDWDFIKTFNKNVLTNILHLDNAEVLYHYRNTLNGHLYPIYYEHDNSFITKSIHSDSSYTCYYNSPNLYIKDYTSSNLKLL